MKAVRFGEEQDLAFYLGEANNPTKAVFDFGYPYIEIDKSVGVEFMERLLSPFIDYHMYSVVDPEGAYEVLVDCDYAQ